MNKSRAVVIGSGLGGLSAAISLASLGWKVTIVEKNDKPGGKLNTLTKDGFTFDLGPSLLIMPHLFRALFSKAGKALEHYLELKTLTVQWRNFFPDQVVLDFMHEARLTAHNLEQLSSTAPNEFLSFLNYAGLQSISARRLYFHKGTDRLRDVLFRMHPFDLQLDLLHSMHSSVSRLVKEPHTRNMLDYFCKYVGSSPDRAPGYFNMLPSLQLDYGVHYVKGGMYNIARALQTLLDDLGVELETGWEAADLISSSSKHITGVVSTTGRKLDCDLLVSNMEAVPFYAKVAGLPREARNLEKRFPPSCSGLVIHLGVKKVYPQLAHHNIFHSATPHRQFRAVFEQFSLPDDPSLYVVAPVRTDPTLAPGGCDIIKILPQVPHLARMRTYSPHDMNSLRATVIRKLESMGLEKLQENIISEVTLTPYDLRNMYFSNRGSIYGAVSDRWINMGFKAPQKGSVFSNLFFVGGSVNPGGGMPMVILGGMQVADRIGFPR